MPQLPPANDQQLFVRLRAGDAAALDELFRRYYTELCQTANRFVRSEDQAEDIVQELFLGLWKRHAALPDDLTAVGGYLHRAARNRSLNFLRDQKRIPISEDEIPLTVAADGLPTDALEQDDLRTRLHRAIDHLPERCRLVFTMSKLDEMTQREVADALDISPKTVENQMTRAYRFLRDWLAITLLLLASFA